MWTLSLLFTLFFSLKFGGEETTREYKDGVGEPGRGLLRVQVFPALWSDASIQVVRFIPVSLWSDIQVGQQNILCKYSDSKSIMLLGDLVISVNIMREGITCIVFQADIHTQNSWDNCIKLTFAINHLWMQEPREVLYNLGCKVW